jgi:hypothetical protein
MNSRRMLVCPSCGGDLKTVSGAETTEVTTCLRCGAVIQPSGTVMSSSDMDASTPPGSTMPRKSPAIVAMLVGMVALIGSAGFMFFIINKPPAPATDAQTVKTSSTPDSGPAFPITVRPFETLTLEGREAESAEPLIICESGCTIVIKNCKLKAPSIVRMGNNGSISVENSRLEATGIGITAELNAKLALHNSALIAAEAAWDTGYNVEIHMEDKSLIQSGQVAVRAKGNTQITMDDSVISGERGALEISNNAKIYLARGSIVRSGATAMRLEMNPEVRLDNSRIEGNEGAVETKHNAKINLMSGSVVSAKGVAIRTQFNPVLEVDGSRIESDGVALDLSNNAQVRLRNAQIKGGQISVKMVNGALDVEDSQITGPQKLGQGVKKSPGG